MSKKIQVTGVKMVGGAYKNGYRVPGWNIVKLEDGTEKFFGENFSGFNSVCDAADEAGYDTKQFRRRLDEWVKTAVMPPHI